ncbi:hypothetical protein BG74_09225 [Sodalis-like endosymbiont of Proechinophthirus fluctus]|nr:hypothetical protein BG74_09225 [Sodalis-like endosymbiont of Proechinophthirus fluctus]
MIYDRRRLAGSIVCIGFGAFHRAHQGMMTDLVLNRYDEIGVVNGVLLADNSATLKEISMAACSALIACWAIKAVRRASNQGQGYYACGWIFDSETQFDALGLLEWAHLAPVEHIIRGAMGERRNATDKLLE